MKNQQVKKMLEGIKSGEAARSIKRKLVSLFIGVAAAASITACSFDFEGTDELFSGLMDITIDTIVESLESEETELSEIADSMREFAEEAERVGNVEFVKATLVRVVDGDTIVVSISGEDKKVRLIGINTPESVAPENYRVENSSEGVLASDYVKNLLSDVKTVYLQKDKSDTDRYGRLLRYVWLETPEDASSMEEVAEKMLNGILVLNKVAEPVEYRPDTAYADMFDELYNLE